MLWVFSAAVLIGVFCGCLFRAPAIIVLSFITFGGALIVSALIGPSLAGATVTAFLTSAALQLGYLLGVGIEHFGRHAQTRIAGLVTAVKWTPFPIAPPKPAFERTDKGRHFGV